MVLKGDNNTPVNSLTNKTLKHRRRFCRVADCGRIVKSQGLCQRHGATAKQCRVEGCTKQAQGGCTGMCKSHFKAQESSQRPPVANQSAELTTTHFQTTFPCQREPELPLFLKTHILCSNKTFAQANLSVSGEEEEEIASVYNKVIPAAMEWTLAQKDGEEVANPLVDYLKRGLFTSLQPGWHRSNERQVRGLAPVAILEEEFSDWEQDLVWNEILIVTGSGCSECFDYLAFGWGRPKDFHKDFAKSIFTKRLQASIHQNPLVKAEKKVSTEAIVAERETKPFQRFAARHMKTDTQFSIDVNAIDVDFNTFAW